MITRARLFILGLIATILPILILYQALSQGVIGADTTTLYSMADAHINSSTPAANYGTDETLKVQTPEGYAYVRFDLGSIPQNAIITSATMSLYLEAGSKWAGPFGNAHIGCYNCLDTTWMEEILTWENHPAFATQPTSRLSFGLIAFTGYKSMSVTEDVQAVLNTGWLTEVLKFTDGTGTIIWGSRESTHAPKLVVEYSVQPVANITLQSQQDDETTANLGYIKFSEGEFPLPRDIQAVVGNYPIQYMDGYGFEGWETIGDLTVSNPSQNPTTITVSGPGTLKAIGNAQTLTYRYDDSTLEENALGKTGEIFAVRFTPIFFGKLKTVNLFIPRLGYGDPTFKLHVMDDDKQDLLTPQTMTSTKEGWLEIDLSQHNIPINQDFYVGVEFQSDYRPYLGGDRTGPDPERSWRYDGTSWSTYRYDYMIRSTAENTLPLQMIGNPIGPMALLTTIIALIGRLAVPSFPTRSHPDQGPDSKPKELRRPRQRRSSGG